MAHRGTSAAADLAPNTDYARFRTSFLEHEHEADRIDIGSATLENLSEAFWDFAALREPGKTKMRLRTQEGAPRAFSVLEIVTDDRPFLVASVLAELSAFDIALAWVGHPILAVERDANGRRVRLVATRQEMSALAGTIPGVVRESMMQIAFDRVIDPSDAVLVEERIRTVLTDVALVVDDRRPMLAQLDASIEELKRAAESAKGESAEAIAFLEWLKDDHFIFMGVRDYRRMIVGGAVDVAPEEASGLGVLRDPSRRILRRDNGNEAITPAVAAFLHGPSPVITTKANFRSNVHRRVYLDYVGVKRFNADGAVIGERRFLGLFTSGAYNRLPEEIPILRRKLRRVLARANFAKGSYNYNTLTNILETYPRDELFQVDEDELYEISTGIMRLMERPRTRLFARPDKFDRYISALVFIPRERYTSELRERMGEILMNAYDGRVSAFYPLLGDGALVRVHFIIGRNPGPRPEVDPAKVEAEIALASRSWRDVLHEALVKARGEAGARGAHERFSGAFPAVYCDAFEPAEAVLDIACIQKLGAFPAVGIRVYRRPGDAVTDLRIKLYRKDSSITLSKSMPIFEHLGLSVIEEFSYEVSPRNDAGARDLVHLHDFALTHPKGEAIDLEALGSLIESAFPAIWLGEAEDDGFNRLIIEARMPWREVAILRALARYLGQTGTSLSQPYMEETLAANAGIAHQLLELFRTLLDPARGGTTEERTKASSAVEMEILQELESVQSLDQDRILRRYLNLITSILRTNYYQEAANGGPRETIAFKLSSRLVDGLPEPVPFVEIFVYSPRLEGVHLRFGRVSRGGIRWSDRREDFRTEVLGLVKAQYVKNAVIVPSGAKGGFVPKRLTAEMPRDQVQAEGVACYKLFIETLLELTDNLAITRPDAPPMAPPLTVCHDEPDPYLVVAADKGTATFSDIANGIAREKRFWLGDAFASGGSNGYDHKAMAITARGAWEAVKRHFREMETDIQTTPFTVIGVGDMSGDVFGNGMLLSPKIKLIAAFDHRDIFIDPTPDIEKTFEERKRLFAMPRSSWQDFDPKLISEGGGIFSRKLKSIPLSPEMRALLGNTAEALTPNELIRSLLMSQTDLLWFGGIGTYIKSHDERNSEVGDSANDAVRVDGERVQAKVVGEGANLGCTQRGRIAYALKGGRINTDAIDNSAGVDCSDHEVNIKILLDSAVAQSALEEGERNQLLKEMTDDIAVHVLADNYGQTLALTLAEASSKEDIDAHARFIRVLEREGRLKRDVERLPTEDEIAERKAAGEGLTRPEIAVLLAYSKIRTFDELLASNVPDEAALQVDLVSYFPPVLGRRFPDQLRAHRLRREIIATSLGNEMANVGGLTYVNRMKELVGAETHSVARAYAATCAVFGVLDLRTQIDALDNRIHVDVQTEMYVSVRNFLRRQTIWFLRRGHTSSESLERIVARYKGPVGELAGALKELATPFIQGLVEKVEADYVAKDVPPQAAHALSLMDPLLAACDIVDLAIDGDVPVLVAGRAHSVIGETIGFERLLDAAVKLTSQDHWERLANRRIIEDLMHQQAVLTGAALKKFAELNMHAAEAWVEAHGGDIKRISSAFDELEAAGPLTAARLSLALGHVRDLVTRAQAERWS